MSGSKLRWQKDSSTLLDPGQPHDQAALDAGQLAVELGFDVWALGQRVEVLATNQSGYLDVDVGLSTIEAYFDADLFRIIRKHYLESIPVASSAKLREKFRCWSPTLWTWSAEHDAFPTGLAPFHQVSQSRHRFDCWQRSRRTTCQGRTI